jgi:hypothetical protein
VFQVIFQFHIICWFRYALRKERSGLLNQQFTLQQNRLSKMRGDLQYTAISHLPDISLPELAPFLAYSFEQLAFTIR